MDWQCLQYLAAICLLQGSAVLQLHITAVSLLPASVESSGMCFCRGLIHTSACAASFIYSLVAASDLQELFVYTNAGQRPGFGKGA